MPSTVTIPAAERDPKSVRKTQARMAPCFDTPIEGCLQWQREGLNTLGMVRQATGDYFGGEDALARWLDERAILGTKEKSDQQRLVHQLAGLGRKSRGIIRQPKEFWLNNLEARDGIVRYRTSQIRGYLALVPNR